jgi:low affinity Fe/Cu permease
MLTTFGTVAGMPLVWRRNFHVKKRPWFDRFAQRASLWTGRPVAFVAAAGLIVLWSASYPLFKNFDTWQLVINTATTIITFLMVFLIQSTQNRDTAAIHVKLDELIGATKGAHNALLDLEQLSEEELSKIRGNYEQLACTAREGLEQGTPDSDSPEVGERSAAPGAKAGT